MQSVQTERQRENLELRQIWLQSQRLGLDGWPLREVKAAVKTLPDDGIPNPPKIRLY